MDFIASVFSIIPTMSLPVACALTEPELQERRANLLKNVRTAVLEGKEMENGYAYRFPSDEKWIAELANLISLERRCCPFLNFDLKLEPGFGPIWLELTGPPGTREFLNSLFD